MKTGSEKSSSSALLQRSQQSPFFSKRGEDSFFAASGVQRSIEVGQPGDRYEQEADAMAEKVLQKPPAGSAEKQDQEKLQTKPLAQGISPVSPRQNQDREEINYQEETQPEISRKESPTTGEPATVTPAVEGQLHSSKGSGAPLPTKTRQEMEEGFGADFSGVRTHTGPEAAQLSQDLGAQAFTHGQDIYFNSGKYAPETQAGKKLLAHELTHTVQQTGGGNVQKKDFIQKEEQPKKSLGEASADELKAYAAEPTSKKGAKFDTGYITKGGKGRIEFHITKLKTEKYYITEQEAAWLDEFKPITAPKGERATKQASVWKSSVKEGVTKKLKTLGKIKEGEEDKLFTFNLVQSKQKGIVGTLHQIVQEVMVPFWDFTGKPAHYDIEHMIDWQILGSKADRIDNLILLERSKNRKLGTVVRTAIEKDLTSIGVHYSKKFKRVPSSGADIRKKYTTIIDDMNLSGDDLDPKHYYYCSELASESGEGNPFKQEFVTVKEKEIPLNHFLLSTSDKRASYILPYTTKTTNIGAFKVDVDYDSKAKKLKSIELTYLDAGDQTPLKAKKFKKQQVDVDEQAQDRYIIQGKGPKAVMGPVLKSLTLDKMSPILINEEDVVFNGLDISVKGKVDPSISVLKGVDISFELENKEFTVRAEVPLDKIAKNIPKPFQVEYCSIVLAASTKSGFSVAGGLGFSIENLGRGDIFAKVGKTVGFDGTFSFDSRWFSKADIKISYDNGDWSIGGDLQVKPDAVKGLKSAGLKVSYTKDVFSAEGDAKLTVPGIDTVKLAAQFNDTGEFKFLASVSLKALPGLKSGSVEVTMMAKKGEDLKLGVKGEAEPDLPNVPNLSPKLTVSYFDGVFDVRATVNYTKGRFDGGLEVGVTNKTVNEKGEPQGEPDQAGAVVVFGYGKLKVKLFKDITGEVQVRLTPEKQVLVAGEVVVKDLKPFGEGYHFNKELFPFPKVTIPLVGIPGMSVSAFITGGVYFKFEWDPLVLKELKVGFKEININEIEKVTLDISGSVGSMASAEVYMTVEAGLEARVLIAKLTGGIGGEAGLGLKAEAGGGVSAGWSMEKGLLLKEVRAFMNVTPKAIFRLTGYISVDLDLWITSVNLYYHKWILAEKQLGMGNLGLKLDFPIKFKEDNSLILPEVKDMNLEKPNFSGDQGKEILNSAINGEAEKKLEEKKRQIRETIKSDLRNPETQKEMTPTQYTNKMKKKYAKSPDLQEFVVKTIQEESRALEYEQFEQEKAAIRGFKTPLANKLSFVDLFTMWHQYVTQADVDAFKVELTKEDQAKKAQASLPASNASMSSAPPQNQTSTPVNPKPKSLRRKPIPKEEPDNDSAYFRPVFAKIPQKQSPEIVSLEEDYSNLEVHETAWFIPQPSHANEGDFPDSEEEPLDLDRELMPVLDEAGEPNSIFSDSFGGDKTPRSGSPFGFPIGLAGNSPYAQSRIAPSFISDDMRVYSRRAKPNLKDQQPFFGGKGKSQDSAHPFVTKSGIQRKKETVRKAAEEEQKNQMPPESTKRDEDTVQTKGKEDEQKLQTKCKPDELQKAEKPEKEKEKPVQKQTIRRKEKSVLRQIQAKEPENGKVASPEVEQKLLASKGKGFALPPALLQELNQKMRFDFSAVRLHTDAEAAALAEELNALAFTHGQDIYFNQGQYAPHTQAGRQLLVHELTHVMQQSQE
ncbi:eCIS core domain-containing protein [Rufibacter psychrotolerans]|uniref:eCIS core domain-containing protein n=1 Tax=Rufibacter psychrotolerans TaxID=2812556 RepID=UPI001966FAA4|nr:DUF4157 domain-containing protein [Rufibacter sp. SYSU D00308]